MSTHPQSLEDRMAQRRHPDTWVIIPVYNEAPVIAGVVATVRAAFANVVCVDDGSADDSASRIESTSAHLVRHPVNLGQGAALQTGLSYALARPGAEYFVTFDADGQHRVSDAAAMLETARGDDVDVVLGSRFLGAGDLPADSSIPWIKRVVLRTVTALSPTARRLRLTDAHNGLRVLGRGFAQELTITMNGMAHASEITSHMARSRARVREMPVTIDYTDYSKAKGQSLVNGVNIIFDLSMRHRGG